jgi:hypothetical protein
LFARRRISADRDREGEVLIGHGRSFGDTNGSRNRRVRGRRLERKLGLRKIGRNFSPPDPIGFKTLGEFATPGRIPIAARRRLGVIPPNPRSGFFLYPGHRNFRFGRKIKREG